MCINTGTVGNTVKVVDKVPHGRTLVATGGGMLACFYFGKYGFSHCRPQGNALLSDVDLTAQKLEETLKGIHETNTSTKKAIVAIRKGTRPSFQQVQKVLSKLDSAAAELGAQGVTDPQIQSLKKTSESSIAKVRQRLSNWQHDDSQAPELIRALAEFHKEVFVDNNRLLRCYLPDESKEEQIVVRKKAFHQLVEATTPARSAIDRLSSLIFSEAPINLDELIPIARTLETLVDTAHEIFQVSNSRG